MNIVRKSSFRHVFGDAAKKEGQFLDVRPAFEGTGTHIAANTKFLAYTTSGGGGPVVILDQSKPGRQQSKPATISVHKGKVLDMAFSPFSSTMIATASDDARIGISQFPLAGLSENIGEAVCMLDGHSHKVTEVKWNPVASNILASASFDNTIKVWDVQSSEEICDFELEDKCFNMQWNSTGSLLAAATKNKKLIVYDPRKGGEAMTADNFTGTKQGSVQWADNHGKLISVGSSRQSTRRYKIWDPRNLEKPLVTGDIDQSASVMITHYDPDTSMLYMAGKGDGGIKYFELTEKEPYLFHLSDYSTSQSTKGCCFVPKRALDVGKCEVARALRLMRDSVVPISFVVPRKVKVFQKDLYPDTYAGKASQTNAEWQAGKEGEVIKISMNPKKRPKEEAEEEAVAFEKKLSPAELRSALDAANAKIAELEAELKKLKA